MRKNYKPRTEPYGTPAVTDFQSEKPCPSAPVRCVPVVSPVVKFAEIFSPVPSYASPANEWIGFLPSHKETLSPVISGKISGSHWNRVFSAWF